MIPEPLAARIQNTGIVAVLVIDNEEDGPPLARALLAGGVDAMELTLRTPSALEAMRRIRAEVPEMLVGAGTVLTPAQVSRGQKCWSRIRCLAGGQSPRPESGCR